MRPARTAVFIRDKFLIDAQLAKNYIFVYKLLYLLNLFNWPVIDETAMTPTDTSEKGPGSIVPAAGQETGYAQGYPNLLTEIKARIRSAQYAALKTVNQELVGLYWDIGRMIVERQAAEAWGKAVVKRLSADLQ